MQCFILVILKNLNSNPNKAASFIGVAFIFYNFFKKGLLKNGQQSYNNVDRSGHKEVIK